MSRLTLAAILAGIILAAGIVVIIFRTESKSVQNEIIEEDEVEEPQQSRAEIITKVLAAAYPKHIEKAEFRGDDWAVLMRGTWYYFAGGRMLPEDLLENADEYTSSFGIPAYQRDLPPWTEPSPEQAARYRNTDRNSGSSNNTRPQRLRSYFFQDGIWQASSREESSGQVKTIEFLGNKLTIHSDIAEAILKIEERIMAAAENDSNVRSWITGIGEMHGWNWRNVAGSQSRSFHSYGIAIDILPKSLNGKETYWQWAAERGKEWWNIPYEDRYHPPDAVIKAFETYGFIWGGKWTYFDTMHFEYRPEAFILSGLDIIFP